MSQSKNRKFKGISGKQEPFTVFIIHGRSKEYKKVVKFINEELGFDTRVLMDRFHGQTILQRIRSAIWNECDCAVAIMSADDNIRTVKPLDSSEKKLKRYARQNVIYEMGYCLGFFDHLYWEDVKDEIQPVVILKEKETAVPADLLGVNTLIYKKGKIETALPTLGQALEDLFEQVKEYYAQ